MFWPSFTFLHHGIEKVERSLVWKPHKKFKKKVGQICQPKLGTCIGFLYKIVHNIGCLRKFNRTRGNACKSVTAWNTPWNLAHLLIMFMAAKVYGRVFNLVKSLEPGSFVRFYRTTAFAHSFLSAGAARANEDNGSRLKGRGRGGGGSCVFATALSTLGCSVSSWAQLSVWLQDVTGVSPLLLWWHTQGNAAL